MLSRIFVSVVADRAESTPERATSFLGGSPGEGSWILTRRRARAGHIAGTWHKDVYKGGIPCFWPIEDDVPPTFQKGGFCEWVTRPRMIEDGLTNTCTWCSGQEVTTYPPWLPTPILSL